MTEFTERRIFFSMCVFICMYIYVYRYIHVERILGSSSRHKTFIVWEGINLSLTFHFHSTFQKTSLNSISWCCTWFFPKDHLSDNKLGLDFEAYILWLSHINWYFKGSPPFQKDFWEYQEEKPINQPNKKTRNKTKRHQTKQPTTTKTRPWARVPGFLSIRHSSKACQFKGSLLRKARFN